MDGLEGLVGKLYPGKVEEVLGGLDVPGGEAGDKEKDYRYKRLQLYVVYADAFLVDGRADFDTLTEKLWHIKGLGCNGVHVLPFLRSPMVDAGFDVSSYLEVREELGGNGALDRFLARASELGMAVFVDMILNHVSDEHEWYRRAIAGDEDHRDFFVWQKEKPRLLKTFTDDGGVWGRYEIKGREVDLRVIFPEHAGEIPHWRQGQDGNWYYHTFYPQQPDVNWDNPRVFVEYAKILKFWAEKRVSFRLDAIPFVGKNLDEGTVETTEQTHLVVKALNRLVKRVNHKSVFLVEATQPLFVVKAFFGSEGDPEAQMAYDFVILTELWAALIAGDPDKIEYCLSEASRIPEWAAWVTFLRNHDQLSLEFSGSALRRYVFSHLAKKGVNFNKGFGLGGRTASFLDGNLRRVAVAYLLLASLPGVPAIVYGDEIGKENDFEYMKKKTWQKCERLGSGAVDDDARDVNRGQITKDEIESAQAKFVYGELARIFNKRLEFSFLAESRPRRISKMPRGVFGLEYPGSRFRAFINLSAKRRLVRGIVGKVELEVNSVKLVPGEGLKLGEYSGAWVRG